MDNKGYTFTYETKLEGKNIYYMFQRLVLPIIISTQYIPYKGYWDDFEKLLVIIKKWIGIYCNTNDLSQIAPNELEDVGDIITNLKFNCLPIDTQYIEEIDIWYGEFLELWENSCLNKEKGGK